jgi:hypothetical protein
VIRARILIFFAAISSFVISAGVMAPQIPLKIKVPANAAWTDAGLDVRTGDVVLLYASGNISLQKGNPEAFCGPQGLDMQTLQQPMADKNIGALIGKVVRLISIEVNEETKEEIRNELVEMFFVGQESRIEIPLEGRLYLGINELVIEDNLGEYEVTITLEKKTGL